jgi:alkanesulfonate monooxygenase SsuD/methylene tetrahydromethanopterin reductase-like flavin-dependent oxidoreductase (luciferase family)
MDVGIGLPAAVAGADFTRLPGWAAAAEQAGFSSVAVIDRVVYGNAEPLLALAAAAAATSRIRLTTSVLLAPLRHSGVLVGKQASTLQALSGGRFTLGMAVGGRADDYEAVHAEHARRGRSFDRMLDEMEQVWSGAAGVGPSGRPEVLLGGNAPATLERVVRHGDGWVAGGGGPMLFQGTADKVRAAWGEAGKPGAPRMVALAYFALGDDAEEAARSYILDYYAFLGPFAEKVAEGTLTSPERVKGAVAAFEAAGCDELLLFPCSAGGDQVERLAEAAL